MANRTAGSRLLKCVSVVTVGILLQTGGCTLDLRALLSEWVVTVAGNYFTSWAYDMFNVAQPFTF